MKTLQEELYQNTLSFYEKEDLAKEKAKILFQKEVDSFLESPELINHIKSFLVSSSKKGHTWVYYSDLRDELIEKMKDPDFHYKCSIEHLKEIFRNLNLGLEVEKAISWTKKYQRISKDDVQIMIVVSLAFLFLLNSFKFK